MSKLDVTFRPGDCVEVKSAAEIAMILDSDGTLDGLPFMPEMLDACGKRFRVLRQAQKTCVEIGALNYQIREFRRNDVYVLDSLRCTGASHDGCGRLCLIFWKAAWLRPAKAGSLSSTENNLDRELLHAKLKTKTGPAQYFCQSTQLMESTEPLTRSRILLKCYYDVRTGSRGVLEMLSMILKPLWRKTTYWIPRRRLVGSLKRTPVGDLMLERGDWVEIKPVDEIALTLDEKGRNRGLICDFGMVQFRGNQYRVGSRLDRMISEPTGQMREMESTVLLEGLKCLCWNTLGGCPREDFMYWREIWLNRVENREAASDETVKPVGKT